MRRLFLLLMGLCAAVTFTACQKSAPAGATASPSPMAVTTPTPAAPTPHASAAPKATSSPEKKTLSASGVYNGQIDSSFIEITLDGGDIKSCRLSDKLKETFESLKLKEGKKVTFTYTVTDGQYTIDKIETKE